MAAYSKHKERDPRDTVFKIQRILNGIGLFPVPFVPDTMEDAIGASLLGET